jgi:hypothetical protein
MEQKATEELAGCEGQRAVPWRSQFVLHHDIPKTLADAGFIVAAINHPSDTYLEMSRSGDLSALVERQTDIKRLIPIARRICSTAADIFGAEDIADVQNNASSRCAGGKQPAIWKSQSLDLYKSPAASRPLIRMTQKWGSLLAGQRASGDCGADLPLDRPHR